MAIILVLKRDKQITVEIHHQKVIYRSHNQRIYNSFQQNTLNLIKVFAHDFERRRRRKSWWENLALTLTPVPCWKTDQKFQNRMRRAKWGKRGKIGGWFSRFQRWNESTNQIQLRESALRFQIFPNFRNDFSLRKRKRKRRGRSDHRDSAWNRKDERMGRDSVSTRFLFLFAIQLHDEPPSFLSDGSTRPSPAPGPYSPHHLLQRSRSQSSRPIQG